MVTFPYQDYYDLVAGAMPRPATGLHRAREEGPLFSRPEGRGRRIHSFVCMRPMNTGNISVSAPTVLCQPLLRFDAGQCCSRRMRASAIDKSGKEPVVSAPSPAWPS